MSEALQYQVNASFAQLLDAAGCTLAVSVYTANCVLLVSAENGRLHIATTSVQRPMGIATTVADAGLRIAVAAFEDVVVLADAPLLAPALPDAPDTYERLLLPRATYYTGDVDAHEMAYVGGRLLAANTRFSCIAEIDERCSFTPVWTPPFVSALMPEDRCHLNGFACNDDRIVYATAFAASDVARGWSETRYHSGVLMEVPSGRVLLDGLCMPHSPRVYDGWPHVLDSGTGRVLRLDPDRSQPETLAELPGFVRGLDRLGDILFVGLSRIRVQPGRTPPPVAGKYDKLICGVAAFSRSHRRVVGYLMLDDSQDEIFDVRVLPNFRRGAILNPADARHRRALVLPGRAFWGESTDS